METGDTILVSQHNPAMSDIESALTGSLSRAGLGGMQAELPMGGNKITGMAPGVDPNDAATVGQLVGGSGVPVGVIADFAGTSAPTGWLICAGQFLNRADFPDLFEAIGVIYGSGSGTTFRLPDCRGRVIAGLDLDVGGLAGLLTSTTMSPDGTTIGATGGAQTQTLTSDQMPAHAHTLSGSTSSDGDHSHNVAVTSRSGLAGGGSQSAADNGGAILTSTGGAHTHTISGTAASTGGGLAHINVQPSILMSKIIKATAQ